MVIFYHQFPISSNSVIFSAVLLCCRITPAAALCAYAGGRDPQRFLHCVSAVIPRAASFCSASIPCIGSHPAAKFSAFSPISQAILTCQTKTMWNSSTAKSLPSSRQRERGRICGYHGVYGRGGRKRRLSGPPAGQLRHRCRSCGELEHHGSLTNIYTPGKLRIHLKGTISGDGKAADRAKPPPWRIAMAEVFAGSCEFRERAGHQRKTFWFSGSGS